MSINDILSIFAPSRNDFTLLSRITGVFTTLFFGPGGNAAGVASTAVNEAVRVSEGLDSPPLGISRIGDSIAREAQRAGVIDGHTASKARYALDAASIGQDLSAIKAGQGNFGNLLALMSVPTRIARKFELDAEREKILEEMGNLDAPFAKYGKNKSTLLE